MKPQPPRAGWWQPLVLVLTLTACGLEGGYPEVDAEDDPGLKGTVVDRRVDPEKTSKSCLAWKNGKCTSYRTNVTDDKDWLLLVRREDGTQVWVDVDQSAYNQHKKGAIYP